MFNKSQALRSAMPLLMLWIGPCLAQSDLLFPAGRYEISTTISLPHLQESLIKTRTNQTRCLSQQQATDLFPLLKHPSFSNCSLVKGSSTNEVSAKTQTNAPDHYDFELQCENVQAASGTAVINVAKQTITARLDIKMGAKNMTMTQNLNARRIASCQT